MTQTSFKIEIERELDGRWIAEIPSLPGAMANGKTRNHIAAVEGLALRVIADRIEHANKPAKPATLKFGIA
jgi:predicted RNase H-like HicB family nuclease